MLIPSFVHDEQDVRFAAVAVLKTTTTVVDFLVIIETLKRKGVQR